MGNIIVALLVGGFATIALMLPYGIFIAILTAPLGASLLAVIVATGNWLLHHPRLSSKRSKEQIRELDRHLN